MPGQDIFISYSREDQPVTRRFAAAFRQEGFSVWWDDALRSGEAFDAVIEQELRSAKAVVVLWSPRSVTSRWVRAEATLADRHGRLAPVIIEPCDRPIIFELTHTVDLSRWDGERTDPRWQALVNDIHRLVGRKTEAAAPAPAAAAVAERPAEPSGVGQLLGDNMGDLISALSSLRDAMKLKEPQPQPQPEPTPQPQAVPETDDFEQTQVYTSSDRYDLLGEEVHCLELSNGEAPATRHIVSARGVKIGRTAPADIILADTKVSRSHCLIELRDDELYVLDMNSTNGTYVDGARVDGAAPLPLGSVLKVGPFTLVHDKRMMCDV